MSSKKVSPELQNLVSWSVKILGEGIKKEFGQATYKYVEELRQKMKTLRGRNHRFVYAELAAELKKMKKFSDEKLHQVCLSFSLMLELINRCENAYRTSRLKSEELKVPNQRPHAIIFVLTAHPTEARSPEILGLFENIQALLLRALKTNKEQISAELSHLLLLALKVSLARKASPTVADEANNIYSYILKDEILEVMIGFIRKDVNVSFRSWVGGDKDGHPGVNEKTLLDSLGQSRLKIVDFIERKLLKVLELVSFVEDQKVVNLSTKIEYCLHQLSVLKKIKISDGVRVSDFKTNFEKLVIEYEKIIKTASPELDDIEKILWIFPALVVALEVREDSEVVEQALKSQQDFAITAMLRTLGQISQGFEAKWYVRGFVLSMVQTYKDVENGFKLTKKVFKKYEIPVVPLFENEKALTGATEILETLFGKNKSIIPSHKKRWGGRYEVMVGYSDSSKENGVLPSRVMISTALRKIEKTLASHQLTPVFFHGSGGSIERGGGSLKEQTGWWPKSAIHIYKATIQGEMVARNFGSEYILSNQIQVILDQLGTYKSSKKSHSKVVDKFIQYIQNQYAETIQNDDFLSVIQLATPYSFLHHLKIGSRPTKRPGGSIKNSLRAIPWILCWTQTRVLFPTWWGVGSAWKKLSSADKKLLKNEYSDNPVLASYIKALGFTLAKIELGVWKLYLENSQLDNKMKQEMFDKFVDEFNFTREFFHELTEEKEFLWFRPWLQESINFRSSMIHPLNLCQIESLRRGDIELLRNSVTGVACGMLTTG